MTKPILNDKIYGCLYGGAIGDALGYPVEFSSLEAILGRYGPEGVTELPDPALYTDDTQMTLRVAWGLLEGVDDDLEDLDEPFINDAVAQQFVEWAEHDPPRAPGSSCLEGVGNISKGVPLLECGKVNSKGCGAVMRSAPYGLIFGAAKDSAYLAGTHALMTHRHLAAQASAAGLAAGISRLVHEDDNALIDVVEAMAAAASVYDDRTAYMIHWAYALSQCLTVDDVSVLDEWRGWVGDEALAASVYLWAKYSDDYVKAVCRAATSPGDSDSLAAITGNLVGATVGISGIPDKWLQKIENTQTIAETARRIIKLHD